jgi:leader peptidase (prepilin peptidase)/N-methyltransferase
MMIPLFLAWGSFLNVVGYRLLRGQSIIAPRSYCPHCRRTIAWFDNIPLISFLVLGGKCRFCAQRISLLYPFIEFLTAAVMLTLLCCTSSEYWFAYFLFFSALIVTIRTDFEQMLISRYVTLFLVPAGWLFAALGYLPIPVKQSFYGSILGYAILFTIAKLFVWIRQKDGMGQGDLELLSFIGAFLGPWGCWITLFLASTLGSIFGIATMIISGQTNSVKVPFGPFLAFGGMLFVLFHHFFVNFLNL